jgi:hypothetical protein
MIFSIKTVNVYGLCLSKLTLENTEGTIKNGQSRETGNIGYSRVIITLRITLFRVNCGVLILH